VTKHYDWKYESHRCPKCSWEGLGSEAAMGESFNDGAEYHCPSCNHPFGYIDYPLVKESLTDLRAPESDRLFAEIVTQQVTKEPGSIGAGLTTEQFQAVAKAALGRRMRGLPPIMQSQNGDVGPLTRPKHSESPGGEGLHPADSAPPKEKFVKERSGPVTLLRWLAIPPAATLGAWLSWIAFSIASLGFKPGASNVSDSEIYQFIGHAIMGAAFVFCGSRAAPSHRKNVAYALAIGLVLLSGFLDTLAFKMDGWLAFVYCIGYASGAAGVAYCTSAANRRGMRTTAARKCRR